MYNENESRISTAVKAAAQSILMSKTADMDQVLADHLKAQGVDKKFAKVAAQAANKSLSVHYLSTHGDSDRADSFELFEPDAVYALMGGVSEKPKEASLDASVTLTVSTPKQASEGIVREPYENTANLNQYINTLESTLPKLARALEDDVLQYSMDRREFQDTLLKVAQLVKQHPVTASMYCRQNPDAAVLVEEAGVSECLKTKVARYFVLPDDPCSKFLKKASEDLKGLDDSKERLDLLTKNAMELMDTANAFVDLVEYCPEHLDRYTPMSKMAVFSDVISNGMDNIYNIASQTSAPHTSVDKVLDMSFLMDDRRRDRMTSWADIAADPRFKGYPLTDLTEAVVRSMNAKAELENPRMREVLRAVVAKSLVSGNRLDMADYAALAKTVKYSGVAPLNELAGQVTGTVQGTGPIRYQIPETHLGGAAAGVVSSFAKALPDTQKGTPAKKDKASEPSVKEPAKQPVKDTPNKGPSDTPKSTPNKGPENPKTPPASAPKGPVEDTTPGPSIDPATPEEDQALADALNKQYHTSGKRANVLPILSYYRREVL